MAAYAILEVDVHDIAEYLVHQRLLAPLLDAAGARYLARGGSARDYQGNDEPGRLILIEFPSLEAADSFYTSQAYLDLCAQRDSCSRSRILAVEGLSDITHMSPFTRAR